MNKGGRIKYPKTYESYLSKFYWILRKESLKTDFIVFWFGLVLVLRGF